MIPFSSSHKTYLLFLCISLCCVYENKHILILIVITNVFIVYSLTEDMLLHLFSATTGDHKSQHQNEKRRIEAISGRHITLDKVLKYRHLGYTDTFSDCHSSLEVRAEVGLLTHNVLVRGDGDVAWEVEIPACPKGFDPGTLFF